MQIKQTLKFQNGFYWTEESRDILFRNVRYNHFSTN